MSVGPMYITCMRSPELTDNSVNHTSRWADIWTKTVTFKQTKCVLVELSNKNAGVSGL